MLKLVVTGGASNKVIFEENVEISSQGTSTNLMDFLRKKNINIASSCFGEGICKKCIAVINGQEYLTCQMDIESLENNPDIKSPVTIVVSYL